MRQLLLAVFAFALLTGQGCTTPATNTAGAPAVVTTAPSLTPQQAVFAAKGAYAVALTAAVAYKKLPACAPTAPKLCSTPAVVKQLQAADTGASVLLDGAEATVRAGGGNVGMAVTAAEQAVAAFVSTTKLIGSN